MHLPLARPIEELVTDRIAILQRPRELDVPLAGRLGRRPTAAAAMSTQCLATWVGSALELRIPIEKVF